MVYMSMINKNSKNTGFHFWDSLLKFLSFKILPGVLSLQICIFSLSLSYLPSLFTFLFLFFL
jgi:hypothetical protein